MTDAPKTMDAADWSNLPRDMYVVRAWKPDNLFWCAEVAQVPYAFAPEVRYVRADLALPLPDDAEMVERVCADIAFLGALQDYRRAPAETAAGWVRIVARAALSAMRGKP